MTLNILSFQLTTKKRYIFAFLIIISDKFIHLNSPFQIKLIVCHSYMAYITITREKAWHDSEIDMFLSSKLFQNTGVYFTDKYLSWRNVCKVLIKNYYMLMNIFHINNHWRDRTIYQENLRWKNTLILFAARYFLDLLDIKLNANDLFIYKER